MAKEKHYRMFDFSGGLNLKDHKHLMIDSEASDVLNMVFDQRGIVKKRPGFNHDSRYGYQNEWVEEHGSYSNGIIIKRDYGTFVISWVSGGEEENSAMGLRYFNFKDPRDGVGGSSNFYSSSILYGEQGKEEIISLKGKNVSFYQNGDYLYMNNSEIGCLRFDLSDPDWFRQLWQNGSTRIALKCTPIPNIPKCEFVQVFHNRAFFAGDPENPDRLYFSQLNNYESIEMVVNETVHGGETTIGGGGIIDVRSDKDQAITGLTVFQNALVVFKSDSIFSLTGYDPSTDYRLEQLNVKTGCVAPRSISVGNNAVYYLGHDGVYVLHTVNDGIVATKKISEKIDPYFKELYKKIKKDSSLGYIQDCFGIFYESKYYLLTGFFEEEIDGVMHGSEIMVFDENIMTWTKWKAPKEFGHIPYAMIDHELDKIAFGYRLGYFVLDEKMTYDKLIKFEDSKKIDSFQPFTALFSTPYTYCGSPEITKRFKWAKLYFKPNDGENLEEKDRVRNATIDLKVEVDYKPVYKEIESDYITFIFGESRIGDHLGEPKDSMSKKVRFGGVGESIRFTVKNTSLYDELELHGIVIGYKEKGVR